VGLRIFCFRNAPSPSDNSILSYGTPVVIGKTLPTFCRFAPTLCHNCDKVLNCKKEQEKVSAEKALFENCSKKSKNGTKSIDFAR